jgi:hypothetical protein
MQTAALLAGLVGVAHAQSTDLSSNFTTCVAPRRALLQTKLFARSGQRSKAPHPPLASPFAPSCSVYVTTAAIAVIIAATFIYTCIPGKEEDESGSGASLLVRSAPPPPPPPSAAAAAAAAAHPRAPALSFPPATSLLPLLYPCPLLGIAGLEIIAVGCRSPLDLSSAPLRHRHCAAGRRGAPERCSGAREYFFLNSRV